MSCRVVFWLNVAVVLLVAIPVGAQQTYSISDASGTEGTFIGVRIELGARPSADLSFTVSLSFPGAATAADVGQMHPRCGKDSRSGCGEANSFVFFIPLRVDLLDEQDETFEVTVSTDAPGWTATSNTATITIENVDGIIAPYYFDFWQRHDFIRWAIVPGVTHYLVSYRLKGGTADWVTSRQPVASELVLVDEYYLREPAEGIYEFRVKSFLGSVESAWSVVQEFELLPGIAPPRDVRVHTSGLPQAIDVLWRPSPTPTNLGFSYEVAWGPKSVPPESYVRVQDRYPSYNSDADQYALTIDGLRAGTEYGARVRTLSPLSARPGPWSDLSSARASESADGDDGDRDDDGDDGDRDDDGDDGDGGRRDPGADRRPTFPAAAGVAKQRWVVGDSVDVQLPEAVGGDGRLTYRLYPALPAGVEFDAQQSRVFGSPVKAMAGTRYIYRVTDSDARGADSAYLSFRIAVVESADAPEVEIEHSLHCEDGVWWCRATVGVAAVFTDTNTEGVERAWDLGDGGRSSERSVEHAWLSPGFYEVTLTIGDGTTVSAASVLVLVVAGDKAGSCEADAETLCFQDSRYSVDLDWWTADASGAATVAAVGTNDSGLFYFFNPNNWEVLVKVLDGCSVNDHVWVYAASATSLGYSIRVTDTVTGTVREYHNESGRLAVSTTDDMAFSCDPAADSHFADRAAGTSAGGAGLFGPSASARQSSGSECVETATSLCLLQSRYEVSVAWSTTDKSGAGRVARPRTADSGLFSFFDPDNWEMLVKVLDACENYDHIWVFAASATDVGFDLTVRDTVTDQVKRYVKDPGEPAAALADVVAFSAGCGELN